MVILFLRKPKVILHYTDTGEKSAEADSGEQSDDIKQQEIHLENGEIEIDEDGKPLLPEGTYSSSK